MSRGIANPTVFRIDLPDGDYQDIRINYSNDYFPVPTDWSVTFEINAIASFTYQEKFTPMSPGGFEKRIKDTVATLSDKFTEIREILTLL